MAKWFGKVGYISTEEVETAPGVWEAVPIERVIISASKLHNIRLMITLRCRMRSASWLTRTPYNTSMRFAT